MTDNISYDELFNRYENLKCLLHETTKQIDTSFQNVTKIITDHTTNVENDFLNAISIEIGQFRNHIQVLFSTATSKDMDLYHPTRLELKLQQLENERIAGYQKVSDMQNQIKEMEEEKRRTQIELNKNAKLINEYQYQLSQISEVSNIDQNILQSIHQNMDAFENEDPNIQQQPMNGAFLQQQVQQLKKDNLDLRHLVDTLRATTQEYKNRAMSVNDADEAAKHLIRTNSKTNWESRDMDRFQREMQEEINRQNKETLCRITDKQMDLRHLNKVDYEKTNENNEREVAAEDESIIDDDENYQLPPRTKRPHSFRHGTVTDWDQNALNKLNVQMKQELKDLTMKDKQWKLEKQFAIQDRIRDSEYRASEILVEEHEHKYSSNTGSGSISTGNNNNEQNGVVINMSMNMNINLNDNQSGSDIEYERLAMQNKLKQMAKNKVMDMSVRNMQQTYNTLSEERMLINPEDAKAAQLQLLHANKQKLLMKSEKYLQSAPQIKPKHKLLLTDLLMDIGILNESIQDSIWMEIEKSIQRPRYESVDLRFGDETSMDADAGHTHQNSDVSYHKSRGGSMQAFVNLNAKAKAMEDEYLAFKADVDLQMNELRDNIQELNEENENLKIHIQTLTDNQTSFNLEIEKYEKVLNEERLKYEHLTRCKISLAESTSREIDCLRAIIVQVSEIFKEKNK